MNNGNKNKYDLSRHIPEHIKYAVRKRAGFGCVICGLGIYQYEHIEPEFKDAKEHTVEGITLLCERCHGKKTRHFLAPETVKKAMENPKSLEVGFSKEVFDIGSDSPTIVFAGITFKNCENLVVIENEVMLKVMAPEENGAPFRLSGMFTDCFGNRTLYINNNEWLVNSENWVVGQFEIFG